MKKVTLIDYGIGNLLSVANAFRHFDAEVELVSEASKIENAELLVLPGVGAFRDGMKGLQERGLVEPIREFCNKQKPFLGICLGMQMMLDESEEFGSHQGLGIIPGKVRAIPNTDVNGDVHKIPHIGWNELLPTEQGGSWDDSILAGTEPGESVYFVHSFMADPTNPSHRLSDTSYGGHKITATLRSGSLYGCQFHPEKSGKVGLKIIQNFLNLS